MKKIFDAEIISNKKISPEIFKLELNAPELEKISSPGQFVQVKIPSEEFTLRRPFGIASVSGGKLKIFYRLVGRGTKFLSQVKPGEILNLVAPLGNGFNLDAEKKYLLVGGGMGLAPLLSVAEKIPGTKVLIGGKNKSEVDFWIEEFGEKNIGGYLVTTDDGSFGEKGFVTEHLEKYLSSDNFSAVLTCGPEIMMRGVAKIARKNNLPCEVSFERRMACGLGACLSCSIDTANGRKKVCKDGPVFNADEVF